MEIVWQSFSQKYQYLSIGPVFAKIPIFIHWPPFTSKFAQHYIHSLLLQLFLFQACHIGFYYQTSRYNPNRSNGSCSIRILVPWNMHTIWCALFCCNHIFFSSEVYLSIFTMVGWPDNCPSASLVILKGIGEIDHYPTLAREFQGFRVWGKFVFRTLELTDTPTNLANQVEVGHALDQSRSVQSRGPERAHQNNEPSWRSSRADPTFETVLRRLIGCIYFLSVG